MCSLKTKQKGSRGCGAKHILSRACTYWLLCCGQLVVTPSIPNSRAELKHEDGTRVQTHTCKAWAWPLSYLHRSLKCVFLCIPFPAGDCLGIETILFPLLKFDSLTTCLVSEGDLLCPAWRNLGIHPCSPQRQRLDYVSRDWLFLSTIISSHYSQERSPMSHLEACRQLKAAQLVSGHWGEGVVILQWACFEEKSHRFMESVSVEYVLMFQVCRICVDVLYVSICVHSQI